MPPAPVSLMNIVTTILAVGFIVVATIVMAAIVVAAFVINSIEE